jgi:hypothetical protein
MPGSAVKQATENTLSQFNYIWHIIVPVVSGSRGNHLQLGVY